MNGTPVYSNGGAANGDTCKPTQSTSSSPAPRRPPSPSLSPSPPPRYDPSFTSKVIASTGNAAHPRLAEIMPSLLRHLHDFAREVHLTADEWMAAVQFLNESGKMSDDRRNETQLICDILGLESLVDEITVIKREDDVGAATSTTSSAIIGPFHRRDAPLLPNDASIVSEQFLDSQAVYRDLFTKLSGLVLDTKGAPLQGALLDVWHAAPNGMYEQQDPEQPDMHLRGRFLTDEEGRFSLYCLRPPPYPVPDDGPAGRLLQMLDRSFFRPAHIHVIVTCEGYKSLVTQLFDAEDAHLADDAVFAVKRDLVVDFKKASEADKAGEQKPRWVVNHDFILNEA